MKHKTFNKILTTLRGKSRIELKMTHLVHKDEKGIYVVADGRKARPQVISGYSHVHDMTDGGLVGGERVRARHVSQTPLTRVTLDNGKKLYWYRGEEL